MRKIAYFSSWQDVYDKVDYLSSLGKTQTAAVQRDADIGVAEAERDAGIRVRADEKYNWEQIFSYLRMWQWYWLCFCVVSLPLVFYRKLSARRKWWMWSSWLTQKWLILNESLKCRKLLSIKKWTLRYGIERSRHLHSGCVHTIKFNLSAKCSQLSILNCLFLLPIYNALETAYGPLEVHTGIVPEFNWKHSETSVLKGSQCLVRT